MKHLLLKLAIVGVLVISGGLHAQQVNFSGRWIVVSPTDGAGQVQIVEHTAASLTTRHGSSGDDHVATYKIDGSESRNVLMSHGEEIVTLSRAVWNGSVLTITSVTTYPDGRRMQQTQAWSIGSDGRLTVEHRTEMTDRPVESGRVVYRKG